MEEMSISRALTEVKTLGKRIEKKIAESCFTNAFQPKSKVLSKKQSMKIVDFEVEAKSSYDTITDLIKRREKIKSEILKSNAETIVTIGGKDMPVVEAIGKKSSVEYERLFLSQMKKDILDTEKHIESTNAQIDQNIQKMIEQAGDTDSKKDLKDEVFGFFAEQNRLTIVDPLKIRKKIDKLDEDIDNFLSNVDFALSESNAITKITI